MMNPDGSVRVSMGYGGSNDYFYVNVATRFENHEGKTIIYVSQTCDKGKLHKDHMERKGYWLAAEAGGKDVWLRISDVQE